MMPVDLSKRVFGLVACVAFLTLAACTSVPKDSASKKAPADAEQTADADPLYGFNHAMYEFNYGFDIAILKPITTGYRAIVPESGREMVSNFVENLYTPVVFANSVFQADPENSFATLWRFLLNTTFGGGGIYDFATNQAGLHNRPADFGQTLAIYGVAPGPFLELPVIGPSDIRDGFGRLADAFLTPTNYGTIWLSGSVWAGTAIDARSRNMKLIDGVYDSSIDPYATFKSLYTQKRASDITRAKAARKKSIEKACTVQ
jgi:phospholipid-binding lipoprotein MlaA